ncbi:MAG: hypothetical protein ACK4K0_05080 [Flavobacteriales bacterium]
MIKIVFMFVLFFLASCSEKAITPSIGEHEVEEEIEPTLESIEPPQDILPDDWKYDGDGYVIAFHNNPKSDEYWLAEVELFQEAMNNTGVTFLKVYDDFKHVKLSKTDSLDLTDILEEKEKGYLLYIPSKGLITMHYSKQMGFYSLVQMFFQE